MNTRISLGESDAKICCLVRVCIHAHIHTYMYYGIRTYMHAYIDSQTGLSGRRLFFHRVVFVYISVGVFVCAHKSMCAFVSTCI